MAEPSDERSLLQPTQRLRLHEELEQRLKTYITGASLRLGDRLPPERELAERLGVSRATIRQAVILLEVQGIVEVRQGDGTYLRRLVTGSGESLRELLKRRQRFPEVAEARETLECKLSELAARRRTDDDLKAIEAALERMEGEISDGDLGVTGNAEFHFAVAQAAHNAVLGKLLTELGESILEVQKASLSEPGRPRASLEQHRKISQAIRDGNPRAAAAAMRAHIRLSADVRLLHWNP